MKSSDTIIYLLLCCICIVTTMAFIFVSAYWYAFAMGLLSLVATLGAMGFNR